MATVPVMALNYPIKKWASGLAIAGVMAYLAISGAPAPAIRAAVVAIIAFLAIILDRRALSLRSLAVAAVIVILIMPEAVSEPGFQMSFSATAALLALAESTKPVIREMDVPGFVRALQGGGRAIWLSLMASLVAGAATTPFSLHYFNRISIYGLISNLVSSPIASFILMPALALGTALQATPLGGFFLHIAGFGLWLTDKIAAWTASLQGAVRIFPSAADYVLLVSFVGILWLCLIRGQMRWLGMLAAVSIVFAPRVSPPDIWVDAEAANAAIRIDNHAFVMRPKVKQYGYDQWLRHYGLNDDREVGLDQDYDCKSYMCIPNPTATYKIGFWFGNKPPKSDALSRMCENSELIVLRTQIEVWPDSCAKTNRIQRKDISRLGALELTRLPTGWQVKASEPLRGTRPWVKKLMISAH